MWRNLKIDLLLKIDLTNMDLENKWLINLHLLNLEIILRINLKTLDLENNQLQ